MTPPTHRYPSRVRLTAYLFGVLILVLLLIGAACDTSRGTATTTSNSSSTSTTSTNKQVVADATANRTTAPQSTTSASSGTATSDDSGTNLVTAIEQVTQKVKPAVVQITNEQSGGGVFNQSNSLQPTGVGSGVIYDSQGHILTNNHVVAGAQKLVVSLPDGRSFNGKVIGTDPDTDLAVIQISGNNLPVANLGNSDSLKVGQWVVAIGNALALPGGPTVSHGVVSALDRTVQEPPSNPQSNTAGPFLFDVIQTDAPINPGNSGGPLVDLNGNVIGIDTLIAGQAEPGVQAEGIGFAIAISTAKGIADQLVATGHAIHPYMGISYEQLTPAAALQLGVNAKYGVYVGDVAANSPAQAAGIQKGDIITEIDGKPLNTDSALAQIINSHKPGDTITLTVLRNGKTQQIKLKLGQKPQVQS